MASAAAYPLRYIISRPSKFFFRVLETIQVFGCEDQHFAFRLVMLGEFEFVVVGL